MKPKSKAILIAAAGLNAVSLAGALVLTIAGHSIAGSLSYNNSALRWDRSGRSSQVSCFLSDDSGFDTDDVNGLRADLSSALKNISGDGEGSMHFTDAYSTPAGTAQIKSDINGKSDAVLTAVGGDFFYFRNFQLLSGAYFSDKDLMQDGAVIDRSLAWALYGSENVAGQNIYINDVKFYIAGVIDDPKSEYEKKTAGSTPRAYISYDGAQQLNGSANAASPDYDSTMGNDAPVHTADKINCYECIASEPVDNFTYNTLKKYFKSSYSGKFTIVNNTKRFQPAVRAKAYKNLPELAVKKDTVICPYWENASRIADFKLSNIYHRRRIYLVIPAISAVCLLIAAAKAAKKYGLKLISAVNDKITKILYNRRKEKYTAQKGQ